MNKLLLFVSFISSVNYFFLNSYQIIPSKNIESGIHCINDNFNPENNCDSPTNLSFSDLTPYEVTLGWQENGTAVEWEIIYGVTGFDLNTQGTTIIDNDGVTNLLISNLTENTTYDIYVRSICVNNNYSDWSSLGNFTTLSIPVNDDCLNALIVNTFPYSNSQDATWATNNGNFNYDCSNSGMNDGVWYSFAGDGNSITVSVEETSIWDSEVAIFSGDCNNLSCVNSIDLAADIQEITFFSTLGETYYVNIGYYSGTIDNPEGEFNIDIVSGLVNCEDPSNILVSNLNDTSVNVEWIENGIATDWIIIYGLPGFNPEVEGTQILDNDGISNESLNNLNPNQDYDLYVQSLCSDSVSSNLIGPISFNSTLLSNNYIFRNFQYYPNPTNSNLNLEASQAITKVEIFTITGKKILTEKIGKFQHQIDLSFAASGIYLMQVTIDGSFKTFKLIKE